MQNRTGHRLAEKLVTQAKSITEKVWPTVGGDSSTVATELRHHKAFMLYSATFGPPVGEEAEVLKTEGYSYLCN